MAIINKNGFDFYKDIDGTETFILKGIYLDKEIKYIQNNKIKSIALNYFDSKSIQNLDFLKEISFVEKVTIDDINIPLYGLCNLLDLKELSLSIKNKKQHLDFSIFKKLKSLCIDWYKEFPDLSNNNNLKYLTIWKFKPKSMSFNELKLPIFLESIEITESNINNFEGLDTNGLKKIEGHYCRNLSSLNGIDKFNNSLNSLILENCKKIKDYKCLIKCTNLEKLILANCGDIENLNWLKPLNNLKHFSFWNTVVKDGNLSFCKGIKFVSFKNKKHYNLKESDFEVN